MSRIIKLFIVDGKGIIMSEFKLNTPNLCINEYNDLWDSTLNKYNYKVHISDDSKESIIENGISEEDWKSIRQGEVLLESLFKKMKDKRDLESIQIAVIALDSIYHTQLDDALLAARNIYYLDKEGGLLDDIINAEDISCKKNVIKKITEINKDYINKNIYSFATKFCSFCNSTKYPIIDKYSATLIYKYLIQFEEKVVKKRMGDYVYYIESYNKFISLCRFPTDEEIDYKKIDRFLWTYGKLLSKKGYMNFDSVQYISEK